MSSCCTYLILYTVLLRVWLLFYDIKWTKICVINDNQWRYHINNPLHIPSSKKKLLNGKSDIDEQETKEEEEDERTHHVHIEHVQHKTKSDMSWFVAHRQSFGNVHYMYNYVVLFALFSMIISLASVCLLDASSSQFVSYMVTVLPILMICILWLNTPQLNDIFLLRKEVKLVFIYGMSCVIIYGVIHLMIAYVYDEDDTWQLQFVLIFVCHLLMFGIFMFLVYCPLKSIVPLYSERIKSNLIESQRTTSILDDDGQGNVASYCCMCCISLHFVHRIALFNASVIGFNVHKKKKKAIPKQRPLQMVTSSSHNALNPSTNAHQIELTIQKENHKKKMKFETDDHKLTLDHFEEDEIFVPIKSPKRNDIAIKMNETPFELLQTEDGLKQFIAHCAVEYSLSNVFALIELHQFQTYVKQQERYLTEQRAMRKKNAKQRTIKKRQLIKRAKRRKSKEIADKKEELLQKKERRRAKKRRSNTNSRRTSLRRRKGRIKQNRAEHAMIDDDDLVFDAQASKTPIGDECVAQLTNAFATVNEDGEDAHGTGNEGDDEDDSDDESGGASGIGRREQLLFNINESIHNLPESSIIFGASYVHSKTRRIQQMQEIVIALAQKYIVSKSVFELNIAPHIVNDIEDKVNQMKKKKNRASAKGSNYSLNNLTDDELAELDISISDAEMPPQAIQLELNYSGSNYSLNSPYAQNHETKLLVLFDPVMDCLADLIADSLYRFNHQTKGK
eukprot:521579_1